MYETSTWFISKKLKDVKGTPPLFPFLWQAILAADVVVVMANGLIDWFGTLDFFLATPYSRIPKTNSSSPISSAVSEKDTPSSGLCEFKTDISLEVDSTVSLDSEERNNEFEAEARKEGRVELGVYKWVILSAGYLLEYRIEETAIFSLCAQYYL
jgi:ATP-binding cassette, subfamily C (CFTR/MRP), member 10